MAEQGLRRAVRTRESGGSNPPPLTNAGVAQVRQSAPLQKVEMEVQILPPVPIFLVDVVVVVQRLERSIVDRVMSVRFRSITPRPGGLAESG